LSAILNTVEISGGDGGVRILWKNPSNIHAFINIEYEGNVLRIDANSLSREYTLSGLDLNRIYTFQVSMIYEEQVSSASKMFSVTTLPAYRKLIRSEEHTSELQSRENLVCRLLLEKKKNK